MNDLPWLVVLEIGERLGERKVVAQCVNKEIADGLREWTIDHNYQAMMIVDARGDVSG